VGEVEDLIHEFGFAFADFASGGTCFEDQAQFLFGVDFMPVFSGGFQTEGFEDLTGGPVQELDGPLEQEIEPAEGVDDGEGDSFGLLDGEGFGSEFADNDVECGDDGEGDSGGDGVARFGCE